MHPISNSNHSEPIEQQIPRQVEIVSMKLGKINNRGLLGGKNNKGLLEPPRHDAIGKR